MSGETLMVWWVWKWIAMGYFRPKDILSIMTHINTRSNCFLSRATDQQQQLDNVHFINNNVELRPSSAKIPSWIKWGQVMDRVCWRSNAHLRKTSGVQEPFPSFYHICSSDQDNPATVPGLLFLLCIAKISHAANDTKLCKAVFRKHSPPSPSKHQMRE